MLQDREVRARLLEIWDNNPSKVKFCEMSRRLLSLAYEISNDKDCMFLTEMLTRIAEGTSVYVSGIGEFLYLYGMLEQRLKLPDKRNQKQMEERMRSLAEKYDGTATYRTYRREGEADRECPLPLYVRNVLAHSGTNRLNTLTIPDDVDASIEILKWWLGIHPVAPEKEVHQGLP